MPGRAAGARSPLAGPRHTGRTGPLAVFWRRRRRRIARRRV